MSDYEIILNVADSIQRHNFNFSSLSEIAQDLNFEIRNAIENWSGSSAEDFLYFMTEAYGKAAVAEDDFQLSLFAPVKEKNTKETFSHADFCSIVPMSNEEFEHLQLKGAFYKTKFGEFFVASDEIGIVYMVFVDEKEAVFADLKERFPFAICTEERQEIHQKALAIFENPTGNLPKFQLHMHGTTFQLQVWQELLKVPFGKLITYSYIAGKIDRPDAPRATGTAIGANPIAFLLPCHRCVRMNGEFGKYRWGIARKLVLNAWEGKFFLSSEF